MTEKPAGDEGTVRVRIDGAVGRITLDRPQALNALSLAMLTEFDAALTRFEEDAGIAAVLVEGAGGRAFSAGGDIRRLSADSLAAPERAAALLAAEYRLAFRIAHYPKPYVALMDGIVIGAGIGLSAHGMVRIVTERTLMAMPEVGIGFMPDVGTSWMFARAGALGTLMAVTGDRFGAADAILLGMADHLIPSAELPAFVEALVGHGFGADPAVEVAARATGFAVSPPPGRLAALAGLAEAAFAKESLAGAVAVLAAGGPAGEAIVRLMETRAPLPMCVTFEEVRRVRRLDLAAAIDMEYRASLHGLPRQDFREGVRAAVIDRTHTPLWDPPTLADVDPAAVAQMLAPLGERELGLAASPA